jgi:hypothetical protein
MSIQEQKEARRLAIISRYFVGDAASGEDRFAYEINSRVEARWDMLREEHQLIILAEAGIVSFWPRTDHDFFVSEFEEYKEVEADQVTLVEQASANWYRAYDKLSVDGNNLSKATVRKYRRRMRAARNLVARERNWGMTGGAYEAARKFFAATRDVTVP